MTVDLTQLGNLLTTSYGIIGLVVFGWTLLVTTWALFQLPGIKKQLEELPDKVAKLSTETDRLDQVLKNFTSKLTKKS